MRHVVWGLNGGRSWQLSLGRALCVQPHHLLLGDQQSLSRGASDPRQPGLTAPLLSPGPSGSKSAEELSALPTVAT